MVAGTAGLMPARPTVNVHCGAQAPSTSLPIPGSNIIMTCINSSDTWLHSQGFLAAYLCVNEPMTIDDTPWRLFALFLSYRISLGLENTMHDDERWVAF